MRRILLASTLSLAATLTLAAPARAQVCATIDAAKDNLTEEERKGALTMLSQALANSGLTVVPSGCTSTYIAYHVRFGQSVTVYITGPQGSRNATARSLEDVPPLYDQMVRSLVSGQAMSSSNNTVDRTNVTQAQMAPNRVTADSLWYLRLGYGMLAVGDLGGGPAIGFGYRYELDTLGIDASFLNLVLPTDEEGTDHIKTSGSIFKLMGLYFVNPVSNFTPYFGGGVSWGVGGIVDKNRSFSGSGLQGEVSAGYELLRASTIRMFVQLDAGLPFFTYKNRDLVSGAVTKKWGPTFTFSLGVGWGRDRTITVRTIR